MGNRLTALLAVATLGALTVTPPAFSQSLETEVRKALEDDPGPGLFQHGAGFYVANGRLVVTSAHGTAGCRFFKIVDRRGRETTAGLVSWDARRDVAILRPVRQGPGGVDLLRQRPGRPDPDQALRTFVFTFEPSAPAAPERILLRGTPRLTQLGDIPMLSLDVALEVGASGSPIADDRNQVIGMVNASVETGSGQVVTLAVPAETLRRIVQEADGGSESARGALVDPEQLSVRVRCV